MSQFSAESLVQLYADGRRQFEGVDLFGAVLTGADLKGVDLSGANLTGANLAGANLEGARLIGTDFYRATLTEARLGYALLEGANLEVTKLDGADLGNATYDASTRLSPGCNPDSLGMRRGGGGSLFETLETAQTSPKPSERAIAATFDAIAPKLSSTQPECTPQKRQWRYRGRLVNG